MNLVSEIFNAKKAACREFNIQEINYYINHYLPYVWSWGFENPKIVIKNKAYRFEVNGHLHKGYVYIILDGSDTFTIYYTDINDVIQKITDNVYIDELLSILDKDIEKIDEYEY